MTVGDGGDGSRGDGGQRGLVPGRRGESGRAAFFPPPRTAWAPPFLSPWPSSPSPTLRGARPRRSCTAWSASTSSRFSRAPASTTRAGCPGTSSRSCARTSSAGVQRGLHPVPLRHLRSRSARCLLVSRPDDLPELHGPAHVQRRGAPGRPGPARRAGAPVRLVAAVRAAPACRPQGRRARRLGPHLR